MTDINELKKNLSQGEYAYLIGNGINLANGGTGWDQLLKSVVSSLVGRGTYIYDAIGKQGITNTEIQNIIPLEYNRKRGESISPKEIMQHVCNSVSNLVFPQNHMLDYIKNNNAEILTTNYDLNIENYLWKEKGNFQRTRDGNEFYKTSNFYPWDYYYCEKANNRTGKTSSVWHIHGDIDHWQSIILSLSQYVGASNKAKNQINMSDQTHKLEKCAGTWLHSLFTKPLIIAGLALDPQEFFLRYLLIERAGWIKFHGIRMQPSFYLSRAHEEKKPGKSQFLSFLGIKTILFRDNNIYNDPIWN